MGGIRYRSWYTGLVAFLVMIGGFPAAVGAAEIGAGLPATPLEALAASLERLVVRVEFPDRTAMNQITRWVDPWQVELDEGFLIVDVGADGYRRLLDLGLTVELLSKETVRANTLPAPLPGQDQGIPGFPCYRTVEETLAAGQALAIAHPTLASWIDIGDSWEKTEPGGSPGFDLMVLKLTNQAVPGPKPALWVEGAIHPRELTTAETVTRYAEHLLANYGTDPDITWVLDHHEIHLLLMTNPDGRKHAETGLLWRKNTNENYCSPTSEDRGADLDRNFDFGWGCCGGSSGNSCDETYRGPSLASEPETQAIQNYVATVIPDQRPDDLITPAPEDSTGIFIDIHSYGGDVLTAFGFQDPPPPNDTQILTLARKFAYFTGYEAQLGSGEVVDGSAKDWAYGRLGAPAYTFKLGTAFFQQCTPFESTIYPDNLQTLLYAARVVRRPYTQPAGPDAVSVTAFPNLVAPGDPVQLSAVADDTRYEAGSGEPTQNVVAAELYVDVPPWTGGASPIAMAATDGTFDSSVEGVDAMIDTSGLAEGRYTIFVRALDAAGHWGAVSAAFVWVLNPGTAAHLVGEVTSIEDGSPLNAAVSAGIFETATQPGDGSYDLALPPGTYDVTARTDGYAPFTVEEVGLAAGATVPLDLMLAPVQNIFADDVEAGNQGWIADFPWAITEEASLSPTHSWTDSPEGEYGNLLNVSLTSPAFNVGGLTGVALEFAQIFNIEDGFDFGYVEVSSDNGANWTTVASYTDVQPSWEKVTLQLPELEGVAAAQIRFRLGTDSTITAEGWHVDDIIVRAAVQGVVGNVFEDGFESGDTSSWSVVIP
jgi:carboxypeptidase T